MSKPRYIWWGYVRGMIRQYPSLQEQLNDLRSPKMAADYNGMPHDGGPSKQTEDLALQELPRPKMAEYEAVRKAERATLRKSGGADRVKLIGLVYWPAKGHKAVTVKEAALLIPCDYSTARRWHKEFIYTVARFKGDLL